MEATLLGLGFGLTAGISPGPLTALVIEATLARGLRAGIATSMAPLLSDGPLIVLAVLVLHRLPQGFLQALTFVGGSVVVLLGIRAWRDAGSASLEIAPTTRGGQDFLKASIVNWINPNPWIFWITIGGPILLEAWPRQPADAIGFLTVFLSCLVGLKIVLALAVTKGRNYLTDRTYRRLLQGAAALLILLGAVLLRNGVVAL